MHTIKDHAMFSGKKLRSSFTMIDRCLKLTVHLTNAKIKHACGSRKRIASILATIPALGL